MSKKKNLIFFLAFILLLNCSFDDKTGIWSGEEKEKRRISELEKEQGQIIDSDKIYSSENIFSEEKVLTKEVILSKPKKNLSWKMSGLNQQNFLGNIYLSGTENLFLKKKIGKNKFDISRATDSPLIYENDIFFSDDNGTIFSTDLNGKINWKKNIYKKIYKKIFKNLTLSIHKNKIYVADNIGFVYSIDLDNGKLVWIKNHGIPLKSKIKIFDNKIFLINQDNRILSFNTSDGSAIWNIRSIPSFIKSQSFLSLALSNQGYLIASTSSGDLMKVDSKDGYILWSLNTLGSMLTHATDFFKSSDVVIDNENIIFSTQSSMFSYNLENGYMNWQRDVSSVATPIIDGKNIFFVTENGYFVIMDADTGKIVSSNNILKVLKKKKQLTKITAFIMGSGKIFSVTLNGYLIISSANTGKTESFKKIGDFITSPPIINDGKLFIYTEDSRILGFN